MARKSEHETAASWIPPNPTITNVRAAATDCRACPLWKLGTQTVFGEGRLGASIMLVGEKPGDKEDIQGKPFVGPAGGLLDKALAEAGIPRRKAYVTNVVKHFKWERKGKRRIHKKPNATEINACRPWLDIELELVKPKVVVCLGATAAQAIIGKSFRVTRQRGDVIESEIAPYLMGTVHPSSILRTPEDEARRREHEQFVEDLKRVAKLLR